MQEMDELKGLLAKLWGLGSNRPMDQQPGETLHAGSGGEDMHKMRVQNFWPVNQEELEMEKAALAARFHLSGVQIRNTVFRAATSAAQRAE